MNLLPWSLTLKIIATSFHSAAIACTIFRLIYRWYVARFWWEDGWAAVALVLDVMCLASTWLEAPAAAEGLAPIHTIANWIVTLTFTSVLWACRTSILFSIVRVANPSQRARRVAFLVGCSFGIMWVALMTQKIYICVTKHCKIGGTVGLSQLITDSVSDVLLVALPVWFLRRAHLTYRRRIMVFSVFSATMLITAVTILHSFVLFTVNSDGIIVIGHVKTAVALIVCNLLVIVAFVYRVCCRGKAGDIEGREDTIEFTTVDLNMGNIESTVDKRATMASRSIQLSEAGSLSTTQSADGVV